MMITPSRLSIALTLLLVAQPGLIQAESEAKTSTVSQSSKQTIAPPESALLNQTASQSIKPDATIKQKKNNIKPVNISILKKRLRKTSAIGFFTKLALRNDLVDLMDEIKKYRKQAVLSDKLSEIRASFDGLLLKLIALLDEDPDLSRDLYVGRESIWKSLFEEKA